MGMTSENVAEKFGISREKQDTYALRSHRRATEAIKNGYFKDEIVPVKTIIKDAQGQISEVIVDTDECPRGDSSMESLAQLPSSFKKNGSSTAGNSSQLSDGASAVLIMTRSRAMQLGIPILAIVRSYACVGVPPEIMGIGPAVAIPTAIARSGLSLSNIDLFEINEAFASQLAFCIEKLKLNPDKVNCNGGGIALGHPLGCTGVRLTTTLLHQLRKKNLHYGVVSMCVGTGMGVAAVFEKP